MFLKYGLDNFTFEIVEETNILKEREEYFIELLNPKYNNRRVVGQDSERYKEYRKKYYKSEVGKSHNQKYLQSEKVKACHRKACLKYDHQLCEYNGEILTLHRLSERFRRAGIPHSTLEAKKYLIQK